MNRGNRIKKGFSLTGKMNRTEYLGDLLVGIFIFPGLGLLIWIIVVFYVGVEGIRYALQGAILFSLIWVYNLTAIGKQRYNDVSGQHQLFFVYVVGILILFYGWFYLGVYSLLGLIPIILFIFIPGEDYKKAKKNQETFSEQLQFYQKYDYDFTQLFTARIVIITILFSFFIYFGIDSYFYNSNNYGKSPTLVTSNTDIADNMYAEINIEGATFVPKNPIFNKELILDNGSIDNLVIDTDSYGLLKKIENHEITSIKGKITSSSDGYKMDLRYIPDDDGKQYLIFVLGFILLYLIIVFKDVAQLKKSKVSPEDHKQLESLDYKNLLGIINNKPEQPELAIAVLLDKLIYNSMISYNKISCTFENINTKEFWSNNMEINKGLYLKENIKNLQETEVISYFEKEELNNSLILAYIIKKYYENDVNISGIICELERTVELNEGKKVVKKLLKDSNYIYHEVLKELVGDQFQDYKNNKAFQLPLFFLIMNAIVYHRLCKQEEDIASGLLNIINPLGLVVGKIGNKMKGY